MEIVDLSPKTSISRDFKFEELAIRPLGDTQLGAEGVSYSRLNKFIREGKELGDYWVGTGDYVDFMSPSNRQRLAQAALYDTANDIIAETGKRLVDDFLRLVKGTEGKWLFLLQGHHYLEVGNGETTDTLIAKALGCPFVGTCVHTHLSFHRNQSIQTADIWAHHGIGGGSKAGAGVNKIETIASAFDADIYLMGHTTKRAVAPLSYIYYSPRDKKLHHKDKYLVNCGGWLAAYQQGNVSGGRPQGDYAEQRMLTPASLGGTRIRIIPHHSGSATPSDYIEIKVEL